MCNYKQLSTECQAAVSLATALLLRMTSI